MSQLKPYGRARSTGSMKRIFRTFIVLSWATAIGAAIVSLATRKYLPAELTPYLESRRRLGLTQLDGIVAWIDIILFLVCIMNSVGLFLFRRWARTLLVPLYVVATLLIPTNAVYIQSGWTRMLFSISSVIGGMIIALVFFSPLREVFDRRLETALGTEPE